MSLSGSKSSGKTSQQSTQTSTLSDRAVGMTNNQIGALQGQEYQAFDPATIAKYLNPNLAAVRDATLAQADQADAVARNQQKAAFAKAGAFGDTRRGVYEAELDAAQSRDRASLIAGLNSDAYDKASTTAQTENTQGNAYSLSVQQLINQLISQFSREGTTNASGSGKTSGTSVSFEWTPKFSIPGIG